MSVKQWFRELRPLPLYLMMALTILFFLVELVASHITHALTLLVDSYHTLCNLIALTGCLITVKYGKEHARGVYYAPAKTTDSDDENEGATPPLDHERPGCGRNNKHRNQQGFLNSERKLKNTFGWARIEVLLMMVGTVFLASLCFSLIVEAVQTLFHIGHSDAMHYPLHVMIIGACGLILNGACYFLIGGYTFHQGSFLHVNAEGNVVLDRDLTEKNVRVGSRQLSARRAVVREDAVSQIEKCEVETKPAEAHLHSAQRRQGAREMFRDVSSCLFVIVCAAIVYQTDPHFAKYIDPGLSIVSSLLLLALSYPYMRESSRILLQTIPGYMDIKSLKKDLAKEFPSIENIHEVHIWCLTQTKVFATAHIVIPTHDEYISIKERLMDFFHERGVTQATLQPEFSKSIDGSSEVRECYLMCQGLGCQKQHCCSRTPTSSTEDLTCEDGHSHSHEKGHSHDKGHSHGKKHSHAKGHSHDKGHNHHDNGHSHVHGKNNPLRSEAVEGVNVSEIERAQDEIDVRLDPEESCSEPKGPVSYERQRSRSVCDLQQTRDSFEDYGIKRVKQTSLVDVMHLS
ncbi:uncharacterized protein LOC132199433 isoform X3 [Neocloeon triangulifer]|nr:uncharacterized protein LOC132199433 isoform X3 [Neocloeon triangulifer]XP_059480118.1 uncharacterized protein LOC132199433 isoform X3 [Neocloeon triangulifer]XP_059480119.1 uncharacterized protein LOC132199433 isoform X3 [Neocloeon triangulifer]